MTRVLQAEDQILPVICIAEDRPSVEPAVRILIASLEKILPAARVILFMPRASECLQDWIQNIPNVSVELTPIAGSYSKYNVKPHALLTLLDRGYDDVVWIDSDIVVGSCLSALFAKSDSGTLMITEEMLGEFHDDGSAERASAWGFDIGRSFPFALNSAVLRVGAVHRDILVRWRELLGSPDYLEAQAKPWHRRPRHLLGDQDVLTALLSSREFSHLPVQLLRRGRDILQFSGPYGYTLAERAVHLRHGMPVFIHSLGHKPWDQNNVPANAYGRFSDLYLGCSPYTLAAREFSHVLEQRDWLEPRNGGERFLRSLSFGVIPLSGLPFAAIADARRLVRLVGEKMRRRAK